MEITHFETDEEVITAAAQRLQQILKQALKNQTQLLLLLSGGSNLKVIQQVPLEMLNNSLITALTLDERFSADPQLNNSLQLADLGINIKVTVTEAGETLQSFAHRYQQLLATWFQAHPQGKVIATLGMGPDGHIAGISPMASAAEFDKNFNQPKELAIGYIGNLSPAERVTVTSYFVQTQIDQIVAVIMGSAKQAVWTHFIAQDTPPFLHPIQLLHEVKAMTEIYTDLKD